MNFLNENPFKDKVDEASFTELLRKFGITTRDYLVRFTVERSSRLDDLLRQSGWNGSRYINIDPEDLYVKLLTLYSNYNVEISKYNISNKGNLIKSFCPTLLLEGLLEVASRNEPLQTRKHDFQGVCMLADISGFTKLAAKYSALGAAGLGKLHETTTFFLGQFVEQVYSYEGDGKSTFYSYSPLYHLLLLLLSDCFCG